MDAVITLTIDGEQKQYPKGISFREIAAEYQKAYTDTIVLVSFNNRLRELVKCAEKDGELSFITTADEAGKKTYRRSMTLLMQKAVYHLLGREKSAVRVMHCISQAYYCELINYGKPDEKLLEQIRDEMLRMTLHVDGKPDYTLVLPADEKYLDAVKAYLDIDVFADAMIEDIYFKAPYIGELICDTDCPAVEDYNDFAEALEDIWQEDGMLLTYAAALEAEKPETLQGAYELLHNLDNYQRIVDPYDYGQRRLQETLGLDDDAIYELDGYMDFEKYGADCMENDHVIETGFGRLRRLDPPFPELTQGQQMFQ